MGEKILERQHFIAHHFDYVFIVEVYRLSHRLFLHLPKVVHRFLKGFDHFISAPDIPLLNLRLKPVLFQSIIHVVG